MRPKSDMNIKPMLHWIVFLLALFVGLMSVSTDYKTFLPEPENEKCHS